MREIRIGPATKIDLLDPVGDDVTGRWVLSADGIVYRPKYVPFGVAATYTAQRAETALDLSSWKRWMPLCTSIAASCAVFCEHSQLGPSHVWIFSTSPFAEWGYSCGRFHVRWGIMNPMRFA